jgi:hypothetical protein
MQSLLYNLGVKRIAEPEIRSKRKIANLNLDSEREFSHEEIIESAIKKIYELSNINLFDYDKKVIMRDNQIGYYLNWHIDDCAIFKHKDTEGKKNNIPLDDKYSLFNLEELPKYTMVIYLTSHNIDFTGGEFEFIDEKVKPKKYDVVFFDSREVHRVFKLRDGQRKNILVKFYAKIVDSS